MPLNIDPKIDFAFKKVFGNENNKAAILSFLNSVIKPPSPIVHVVILTPFSHQEFKEQKFIQVDIKATDENGTIYNIEMQSVANASILKRIQYYTSELFVSQIKSGEDYSELHSVHSIWIMDDICFKDDHVVHHFQMIDPMAGNVLDGLNIHTIELPKYNGGVESLPTATKLEQWIFWFKNAKLMEYEALITLLPDPGFVEGTKTLQRINDVTEDKAMYDSRMKSEMNYRSDMLEAKLLGIAEGEARGKAEGEAKGKAEGKAIGDVQGQLRILQNISKTVIHPESEFDNLSLEQLKAAVQTLQKQLITR